jgi:diaphanous 1
VNEEEGVWEGRTASMALVNALINCPESLEERILLRDEFGRRGLNEVIVVRAFLVNDQSISNNAIRHYGISSHQIAS